MHHRCHRALAAVLTLGLTTAAAPAPAASLDPIGTYIWQRPEDGFGGFSAIEIDADGVGFHALTDRARLYRGRIVRDAEGAIRDVAVSHVAKLRDSKGTLLLPGWLGDSEGLAIGADGRIWVSFEGLTRIAGYDDPDDPAIRQPRPPKLAALGVNAGFEALAIRDDGVLVTLPERSRGPNRPFVLLALKDGRWSRIGRLRRDPRWLAVGADFGPDGWFYLLERDFRGLLGFRARVRRMRLGPDGAQDEQILLETGLLEHDNLEGISVWQDAEGVRVTLISDDNFLPLQRTEIVDYRLRD